MNISQILSPELTFCSAKLTSKKKILEKISTEVAQVIGCQEQDVFEALVAREKLGSTSLGNGIAMPHGRAADCSQAVAVFILLDEPIDYDALDGKSVDIIFAIIVPEKATAQQLKYLGTVAKALSEQNLANKIRHAHCNAALFEIIEQATENLY